MLRLKLPHAVEVLDVHYSSRNRKEKPCLTPVIPSLDKCLFHYNVSKTNIPAISNRQLTRLTKSVEAMSKVLEEIKDAMRDDETKMGGEEEEEEEDEDDNVEDECD